MSQGTTTGSSSTPSLGGIFSGGDTAAPAEPSSTLFRGIRMPTVGAASSAQGSGVPAGGGGLPVPNASGVTTPTGTMDPQALTPWGGGTDASMMLQAMQALGLVPGTLPTGTAPGSTQNPNSFGFPANFPYGFPGPVPSGLGQFGTQASTFGNMTGLGNPYLIPLMLLMHNFPTTINPFDPAVQPGSPVNQQGVFPMTGGQPFHPVPGQPLPPGTSPGFLPVPPVPGGASTIPGALPPVGHGPFRPGVTGGGGGEGGSGSGSPSGGGTESGLRFSGGVAPSTMSQYTGTPGPTTVLRSGTPVIQNWDFEVDPANQESVRNYQGAVQHAAAADPTNTVYIPRDDGTFIEYHSGGGDH